MSTNWEYAWVSVTRKPEKDYAHMTMRRLPGDSGVEDLGAAGFDAVQDMGASGWELVGPPNASNGVFLINGIERGMWIELLYYFKRQVTP